MHARGVEYVEIRSLDVNPFSKVGITEEQVNFLDLFLTWCAITPSDEINEAQSTHLRTNFSQIVTEGRQPDLRLAINGKEQSVSAWGAEIMAQLMDLASVFDKQQNVSHYEQAIAHIAEYFRQPELTNSARVLDKLLAANVDNGILALSLAKEYKIALCEQGYQLWSDQYFEQQRLASLEKQQHIEQQDTLSFDHYLQQYFTNAETY